MFKLSRLFILSVGLLLLGLAPVVLAHESNPVQAGTQVGAANDTALMGTLAQTDTVTGTEESTGTIGTDTTETDADVTATQTETDTTETDATETATDTTETDVTTTEAATDALTTTNTTAAPTPATTQPATTLPATGGVASAWPSLLLLVAGAVLVLIGILSLSFVRRSR